MERERKRLPAGWYPDQQGSGYRYWDGTRWTNQRLGVEGERLRAESEPRGSEAVEPAKPAASVEPAPVPRPAEPAAAPAPVEPAAAPAPVEPAAAPRPAEPARTPERMETTQALRPVEATSKAPPFAVLLGVAIFGIAAGAVALIVALTLPHGSPDPTVANPGHLKTGYYVAFLIGGAEVILAALALAVLAFVDPRSRAIPALFAATIVVALLLLAGSGASLIQYHTADTAGGAGGQAVLGESAQLPAQPPAPSEAAPPAAAATTIPDGTWEAGRDFEPGLYRAGGGERCYWETRNRPAGEGGIGAVEDNGFGRSPTVRINTPFFHTAGCGDWVKIR